MFLVNIKRYRNLYTVDGIYSREVRLDNMEKRPYILFLNVYKKKYIYIYVSCNFLYPNFLHNF